jgi:ribosomal protein S18 acetylase RimI-like enzyme
MWIGMARDSTVMREDAFMTRLVEPRLEQVLEFCARDPIERVFVEDMARRGTGRFVAVERDDGQLGALCHAGANLVPSGRGCDAFAGLAYESGSRMIIGEERAVGELWESASALLERPREDRPGQPVYVLRAPPEPGATGLRPATLDDLELLLPACAAAHAEELGIDPLRRDGDSFRWRTRTQIEEGRSWVWLDQGVIRFKAEASAWTPSAVQVQQVWVDPEARGQGYGSRGLRDLCRLLLEQTPAVTLFVRTDNRAAIALYDSIGMRRVLTFRSILFP